MALDPRIRPTVHSTRRPVGKHPRGNAFEPTRQRIANRDGWICQICGDRIDPALRKPNPRALHVHHRVARDNGGSDGDHNLISAHADCHRRHHASDYRPVPH